MAHQLLGPGSGFVSDLRGSKRQVRHRFRLVLGKQESGGCWLSHTLSLGVKCRKLDWLNPWWREASFHRQQIKGILLNHRARVPAYAPSGSVGSPSGAKRPRAVPSGLGGMAPHPTSPSGVYYNIPLQLQLQQSLNGVAEISI